MSVASSGEDVAAEDHSEEISCIATLEEHGFKPWPGSACSEQVDVAGGGRGELERNKIWNKRAVTVTKNPGNAIELRVLVFQTAWG